MQVWPLGRKGGGGGGEEGGRLQGVQKYKKKITGIQYYYCSPVLNILHGVYVVACLSHFIICTVKYFPNYDFQVFWLKVHIMQKGPPSWQFLL